jgi:signal peptidase I
MYPTLEVGDYLFVSKLSYGYSKYSFGFTIGAAGWKLFEMPPLPFDGRIFLAELPKRGDVAVFKLPRDNSTDYIKRVIGLPGDHIQMKDGVLYINGEAVKKEPANTLEYVVPEGHYFMMGDNRDNSSDSRVPPDAGGVGYVPYENFVGRADLIFFSIQPDTAIWEIWKWPFSIRWNRFLNIVR